MKKLPIPEELKLENYDRRRYTAVFDRIDLVLEFRAGKGGIGATIKCFLDAISKHDEIVAQIEDQLNTVKELKRIYRKKNRLFRNLDSAWNLMLNNPVEFHEYLGLLPKMENIEERIEQITDPEIKAKVVAQYDRFKLLEPVCSRQLAVYELYSKSREERDESMKVLVKAEAKVVKLKEEERVLASHISDDHIIADEMKKSMTQLFPNVHVGYILSAINGESVEQLPYEHVLNRIHRATSPHNAEFRRYDYRFDPFTTSWHSLAELRQMGVCVEDPLLQKYAFISAAAKGDKQQVYGLLMQGEDPNATDLTGNTAMIVASSNQHTEVVDLLFKAGANINQRDKNMMTPLLYCINRGYAEMVRQLIDLGADKTCVDRNQRDSVFYAVLSGSIHMVKWFLTKDKINKPDKLWGFTPLHLAASQGNLPLVEHLLSVHASIYHFDRKQRTAEMVAKENGHNHIYERLRDERLNAPGQFIFARQTTGALGGSSTASLSNMEDDDDNVSIGSRSMTSVTVMSMQSEKSALSIKDPDFSLWIGDIGALDPVWCSEIEFSHIIYFRHSKAFPSQCNWLKADKDINFVSHIISIHEEDGDYNDNWDELQVLIPNIFEYVKTQSNKCRPFRLLLCDDNGMGLAPAMACVLLLLRENMRVKDTMPMLRELRPRVEFGQRILKGLDLLQRSIDDKLLKRLNQRLRGTVVNSVAF